MSICSIVPELINPFYGKSIILQIQKFWNFEDLAKLGKIQPEKMTESKLKLMTSKSE